jgi:hypothetical protein
MPGVAAPMRLGTALGIPLVLLLFPLAAADIDSDVGPGHVETVNQDSGDECGGANGYHARSAQASVEFYPDESVEASASSYCSDQTSQWFTNHGNSTGVVVGHRVGNNYGPSIYAGYFDSDQGYMSWCGLTITVVGIPTFWGCLPAGQQIPLFPELP